MAARGPRPNWTTSISSTAWRDEGSLGCSTRISTSTTGRHDPEGRRGPPRTSLSVRSMRSSAISRVIGGDDVRNRHQRGKPGMVTAQQRTAGYAVALAYHLDWRARAPPRIDARAPPPPLACALLAL